MITWLDEEHRRDKALIGELRQRTEEAAVEITDLNKRLENLESRLTATQSRLGLFNTLEQSIQTIRDEVVLMVRNVEEEVHRNQREQDARRVEGYETLSRAIADVQRSLEAIPPLHDRLAALKQEDARLNDAIVGFQTRLLTQERQASKLPDRISYVESQRGAQHKAIQKVEAVATEVRRRVDMLDNRQRLLDELAHKNEQRIGSFAPIRDEIINRQKEFNEEMRLRMAQVSRDVRNWEESLTRYDAEFAKQRALLDTFQRRLDENHDYLRQIEEFRRVIQLEQQQVAELQRLAEERQKQVLTEWIAADEARWTKFQRQYDAERQMQQENTVSSTVQYDTLEDAQQQTITQLNALQRALEEMDEEFRKRLGTLWAIHEETAIFRLDEARRWYDRMSTALDQMKEKSR